MIHWCPSLWVYWHTFPITAVRIASVEAASIAIGGGGTGGGPGVPASGWLDTPTLQILLLNGHLRHRGVVSEPGHPPGTPGAAIGASSAASLGDVEAESAVPLWVGVRVTVRRGVPRTWVKGSPFEINLSIFSLQIINVITMPPGTRNPKKKYEKVDHHPQFKLRPEMRCRKCYIFVMQRTTCVILS